MKPAKTKCTLRYWVLKSFLTTLYWIPLFLYAQYPCQGSFEQEILNANYIHAGFAPRGTKFFTGGRSSFIVPYPMSKYLSTIFASSPWIGGLDDAGNFKQAVETYALSTSGDLSVGPLNSVGVGYDSVCHQFDRAWMVYAEDILRHRQDYGADGQIDDTIRSIFGWPARGNAFFARYNGFDFPDLLTPGRADFVDMDFDGRYDPDIGEYPVVHFQGQSLIPDQMLWTIFNDVDAQDTMGLRPMRFEFQLTAFAMFCQDNPVFNHTIFNVYKLTNRAVTPLDSVFLGMWTDYDLGCSTDDLIGCDSARSVEFVYNFDAVDGDAGDLCTTGSETYPDIPPVQSMTWLSHPMHSFIAPELPGNHFLSSYRLLNGQWPDGMPMTAEGEGNVQGSVASPTRFLFHGDPREPSSWSGQNELKGGRDYKTVSSVSLGRFDPGVQKTVELAYTYHHDPNADSYGQFTRMYDDIDVLRSSVPLIDEHCTRYPVCYGDVCVWPGDFNQDGIANHLDMLEWGVMNNASGPSRDGRIHWRAYSAQDWSQTTALDINFKHGDGNGNGIVDVEDLEINELNHLLGQEGTQPVHEYLQGDDLVITSDPIEASGRIRNIRISTGSVLENIYGLTFELEYDTLFYKASGIPKILSFPADSGIVTYIDGQYSDGSWNAVQGDVYGFVGTNHFAWDIPMDELLMRSVSGISLKSQFTIDDLPDTVVIRLRNIRGIDVEGNRISLGSRSLKLPKSPFTSILPIASHEVNVYPVPSRGGVMIEAIQQESAKLFSSTGMQFRNLELDAGPQWLDSTDLPGGIYFVQIVRTGQMLKVVLIRDR